VGQLAGQRLLPAPFPATPPIPAATTACEAHSLIVTTRTFGNAAFSSSPAPIPENPPGPRSNAIVHGPQLVHHDRESHAELTICAQPRHAGSSSGGLSARA
jgi:hypothetical protein